MTYDPAFEQRLYSAIGATIKEVSMIGDDVAMVRIAETTRALMRALGMTIAMGQSIDEDTVARLQHDLAEQIERARRNPKLAEFVRRTRPMGWA